jgi:hypothetical protein
MRGRTDARYYRYRGHRFSVTTKPVHAGKACMFFSHIHWVERNKEEFTKYTCSRTFLTPQEARMEGIAIVRNWIDDGKPAVNTTLHQAIFESERVIGQLRSAFVRSCNTMERSRVLHAELERVLEQSRRAILNSERKRNGLGGLVDAARTGGARSTKLPIQLNEYLL